MPIIVTPGGVTGSTVTLDTVWLNDAASPWDFMEFRNAEALTRKAAKPARVQRVAGGRLRVITQAGQPREWTVTLPNCTLAQVAWLESHLGLTVCARDHRGHKFFVVYLDVNVNELTFPTRADTSLTLTELSYSEAV